MKRRPPRVTRSDPPVPYTTLLRCLAAMAPSFVFRHVGGRHGGARAQPLFGKAMQILVIEDDARVAEHSAKGLKTAGHGVALESDGRDRKSTRLNSSH